MSAMTIFGLFFQVIVAVLPFVKSDSKIQNLINSDELTPSQSITFNYSLGTNTRFGKPPKNIFHPAIVTDSVSPNLFVKLLGGTASIGYSGDSGPATAAELSPNFLWVDSTGIVYFGDGSKRIRKIDAAGIITTFGGTGTSSTAGTSGPIGSVSFNTPYSIVGDAAGTYFYISDNWYIWKYVFVTNIVSVFAHSTTVGQGFSGDGGPASSARLNSASGLWLTSSGILYVADFGNNRVRKITSVSPNIISTVAGSNGPTAFSGDGGPATMATFNGPVAVYMDTSGKLFISDLNNVRIRVVDTNGIVTTFAGIGAPTPFNGDNIPATSANINFLREVKGDSLGNIYFADNGNCIIRMVDISGIISTIFGSSGSCTVSVGISSRQSYIFNPNGLWIDTDSNMYFSDTRTIRRSVVLTPTSRPSGQPTNQPTSQPSRQPIAPPSAQPSTQPTRQPTTQPTAQPSRQPTCLPSSALISPNLYMQLVAGSESVGYSGDGGPATSAQVKAVQLWVDPGGNIYIPDNSNYRIRKVNPAGIITTFGGTGSQSTAGVGGPFTSTSINIAFAIVGDAAGNFLYFSDLMYVWKFTFSTGMVSVYAGSTTAASYGFAGDGGPVTSAQMNEVAGLWLTTSGSLYLADSNNHRIRVISPTSPNIITTVVGSGCSNCVGAFSGDNGPATLARLYTPVSLYMDSAGKLFIAEYHNNRIRMVNTAGIITTVAGTGQDSPFNANNLPATSVNIKHPYGVHGDSLGNIYIADNGHCAVLKRNSTGFISTLFGNVEGNCGFSPGLKNRHGMLSSAIGLWVDSQGTIYFSDMNSIHRSIFISSPTSQPTGQPSNQPTNQPSRQPTGQPTRQPTSKPTVQPSSQPTSRPSGPLVSTNLFMQLVGGSASGNYGGDNGPAISAQMKATQLWVDSGGNIYLTDYGNSRIRKVNPAGIITTIGGTGTPSASGSGGTFISTYIYSPFSIVGDTSGTALYFSDLKYVWKYTFSSGTVSVYAGSTTSGPGFSGDGSPATSAQVYNTRGLWLTTAGNLFVADENNHRIRMIFPSSPNIIITVAGSGCGNGCSGSFSGDNGQAISSNLQNPDGVYMDSVGGLFIADTGNNRIRMVNTAGIITTVAGSGQDSPFTSGNLLATSANIKGPLDVKGDSLGNIYIADSSHCAILKMDNTGLLTSLFGSLDGSCGFSTGIASRNSQLMVVHGLWLDSQGTIYFTDWNSVHKSILVSVPSSQPSEQPTRQPSSQPTAQPIVRPSSQPSGQPSTKPTNQPTGRPSCQPTCVPSTQPTRKPSSQPSSRPSSPTVAPFSTNSPTPLVANPYLFKKLLAGSSSSGLSGDGGPATSAQIKSIMPWVDSTGNIYIPDDTNRRIRKVTASNGFISTFGGTGTSSTAGTAGPILQVNFFDPWCIVGDTAGTALYISDQQFVWKYFFSTNIVSVYAGTSVSGFSGDGSAATSAQLYFPMGLWLTTAGVLYFSDDGNHRIRKVVPGSPNIISTVAGSGCINNCVGSYSGDGGPALSATLNYPYGIYLDIIGRLFIADQGNHRIRLVDTNGIITTFAGTGTGIPFNGNNIRATSANIKNPTDVKGDSLGNIYIINSGHFIVQVVDPNSIISTLFGYPGNDGFSFGTSALPLPINSAYGLWLDSSANIYVSDYNSIHRSVYLAPTSQPSGQPSRQPSVQPITVPSRQPSTQPSRQPTAQPSCQPVLFPTSQPSVQPSRQPSSRPSSQPLSVPSSCPSIKPSGQPSRQPSTQPSSQPTSVPSLHVPPLLSVNGFVKHLGGTGSPGFSGDNGPATSAELRPFMIYPDTNGNVFIADRGNLKFRKINSAGIISHLGGTGSSVITGAGGVIGSVGFYSPFSIAGNAGTDYIYLSDQWFIWKYTLSTNIVTVFAGTVTKGYSGDNGPANQAQMQYPCGIWVTTDDILYIADHDNNRIRKIASNIMTSVAGSTTYGFSGDGGPALAATLKNPWSVYVDSTGKLFIVDNESHRIRMVNTNNIITTYAGGGSSTDENVPATSAALSDPRDVKGDKLGNIYIADFNHCKIKIVSTSKIIATFIGNGVCSFTPGIVSPTSSIESPAGLWLDSQSNVYFNGLTSVHRTISVDSPTSQPSSQPSGQPWSRPTAQPTTRPSTQPSKQPVSSPSVVPSQQPISFPSGEPTRLPTSQPSLQPSEQPSVRPSNQPSSPPTRQPSSQPSGQPSGQPVLRPSSQPSSQPTLRPTSQPSRQPTSRPSPTGISSNLFMQLVTGAATQGNSGDGGQATLAQISPGPPFVDINGNIYIPDENSFRIRKINTAGIITAFGGTGNQATNGDPGPIESVSFYGPYSIVGDTLGTSLYICDQRYVWKYVFSTNIATVFAHSRSLGLGFSGDNGPATSAQLYSPRGIWLTTGDVLFMGDLYNNRIRKVSSGTISTVAGSGCSGSSCTRSFSGDNGPATVATLFKPRGVYVDTKGRLFIADNENYRIRFVDTNNIITTFAGTEFTSFNGDNIPATSANFNLPYDVKGDSLGNIYVADYLNCIVRMVNTNGIISTLFGTPDSCGHSAGISVRSLSVKYPNGLWVDSRATVYVSGYSTVHRSIIVASPSSQPSGQPSVQPTAQPSKQPISSPSVVPSQQPIVLPSGEPTTQPTRQPSSQPSVQPTVQPTGQPSRQPSSIPSRQPSSKPSSQPTSRPTEQPAGIISPNLHMQLLVGTATVGYSGDNGPATSAQIRSYIPWVDTIGSIYISDGNHNVFRKISSSGIITTFGGTGSQSAAGTTNSIGLVSFFFPVCIVGDTDGTFLYISDDKYIWKYVFSTNIATVFAQCPCLPSGFSGDGGPASSAQLYDPYSLWLTTSGVLYIADLTNHRIRKVMSGIISTVVGSGCSGNTCPGGFSGDGGMATSAVLKGPTGVYLDSIGKLFIADTSNNRIRVVDTNQIITTFAGSGAISPFNGDQIPPLSANIKLPQDVKGDSAGNIYIADGNCMVRVVEPRGTISTVFGNSNSCGYSTGVSSRTSSIFGVAGLWVDSLSSVYFSDANSIHRSITVSGTDSPNLFMKQVAGTGVQGYSGDNGPATSAQLNAFIPFVDSIGNVYIPSAYNNAEVRIRKVSTTGIISTFGGTGTRSSAGTGGTITSVSFNILWSIVGDSAGTFLYICDRLYVWKYLFADNSVVVIAGVPSLGNGFSADNGPSSSAQLNAPEGLWLTTGNVLYIADTGNYRIRKIVASIITTVAGSGGPGTFAGDGGLATNAKLKDPCGVYMNTAGKLFIADSGNNRVRVVDTNNILTTFAGSGFDTPFNGDYISATLANINLAHDVKGDSLGNIYIADYFNCLIRMVGSNGIITTVFGSLGTCGFSAGTSPRISAMGKGLGLWVDSLSTIYISGSDTIYKSIVVSSPTSQPSGQPTKQPACKPSSQPSTVPTCQPADSPTTQPSKQPFMNPTGQPSNQPTSQPSRLPSGEPTSQPTSQPTSRPSYSRSRLSPNLFMQVVAGGSSRGYSGDGGPATSSLITALRVWVDPVGNMYIPEYTNFRIGKVNAAGIISTFIGTGNPSTSGASGSATSTSINYAYAIVGDVAGTVLYFSDIRYVWKYEFATGIISVYAGAVGFAGDGGPAVSAQLNYPRGLWLTTSGVLYVADMFNHRVRTIAAASPHIITTVAGSGCVNDCVGSFSGDGGPATSATLYRPNGIYVDTSGKLFITEYDNHRVRVVSGAGIIFTFAGTGATPFNGHILPATSANLNSPLDVKGDNLGNIYISDNGHCLIRMVDSFGIISRVFGNPDRSCGFSPGISSATSSINLVDGIWIDSIGRIYFCDESSVRRSLLVSSPTSQPSEQPTRQPTVQPTRRPSSQPSGQPTAQSVLVPTGNPSQQPTARPTCQPSRQPSVQPTVLPSRQPTSQPSLKPRAIPSTQPSVQPTAQPTQPPVGILPSNLHMQVLAGTNTIGFSGDNGPATSAQIHGYVPWVDSSGNIYVPDGSNYRIRKVSLSGIITTFMGSGTSSTAGASGPIGSVSFYYPCSIVSDVAGNAFYISDERYVWRYVVSTGIVSVYAGGGGVGFSGDNGPTVGSQLNYPDGLWLTTANVLYVADTLNHRIRKISSTGIITTVVGSGATGGSGSFCGDGGLATSACLNEPSGVYMDTTGRLFVADVTNKRIRLVDTNNIITTFAGTGISTPFNGEYIPATSANMLPYDVKGDSLGIIYFADDGNRIIRMIDKRGTIATMFGSPGVDGFTGGIAVRSSKVSRVRGIWVNSLSTVYFSDLNSIRRGISLSRTDYPNLFFENLAGTGSIGFSGDNGPATSAQIRTYVPFVDSSGNIYLPSAGSNGVRIRKINPSGIISTFGGTGTSSVSGTGGPITSVSFNDPLSIVGDTSNTLLYISDQQYVWKYLFSDSTVSVFAGTVSPGSGFNGESGPVGSIQLNDPQGLWLTTGIILYIVDTGNHRIRKVVSNIITTVAGSGPGGGGSYGFSGDNGPATSARLHDPVAVFVNSNGNIFIAEVINCRIRVVDTNNIITTFAGTGMYSPFNGDYIPATSANLNTPRDVKGDTLGNIYIADYNNYAVRVVNGATGIITTLFGTPGTSGFSAGISPRTSPIDRPFGLWIDSLSRIYISDMGSIHRSITVSSPTSQPSGQPTVQPISFPTGQPTRQPTNQPTLQPSTRPTSQPSGQPSVLPSKQPVMNPTGQPSTLPTRRPSSQPTRNPTGQPTGLPSNKPTSQPSLQPFALPSGHPSSQPTNEPSVHSSQSLPVSVISPNLHMQLLAGTNLAGFSGDNGPATSAQIRGYVPWIDSIGNIYIPDSGNFRIRKVSPSGIITTFGGTATSSTSGTGGPIGSTSFYHPFAIMGDTAGIALYISDERYVWRYVVSTGIVSVYAGSGGVGFSGDNGPAVSAQLNILYGLWLTTTNGLYVVDSKNNRIRKISSTGIITTVVGSGPTGGPGSFCGDEGPATAACLNEPQGMYMDTNGRLFIADTGNKRMRFVDTNNIITTFAGTGLSTPFSGENIAATSANMYPCDVKGDSLGNIYVGDDINSVIRIIDNQGIIGTLFGKPNTLGFSSGISSRSSMISGVHGIWVDSLSMVYFTDQNSLHRGILLSGTENPNLFMRRVAGTGTVGYSGENGPAISAQVQTYIPFVDTSGNIYLPSAGTNGVRIRKMNPSGIISSFGGTGTSSATGTDGLMTSVSFHGPWAVVGDTSSTFLYISDQRYIWKYLFADNSVSRIAGTVSPGDGFSGDDGPSSLARLNSPLGLWLTTGNVLYIADASNCRIRKILSGIITTVAGSGSSGSFSGDGGQATSAQLFDPCGVYMNTVGKLFIADNANNRIRVVDTNNIITTFAGTGIRSPFNGDYLLATSTNLNQPQDVKGDSLGNIYIADYENCIIRMVNGNNGIITTVFGSPQIDGFSAEIISSRASAIGLPLGLWLDSQATIYFSVVHSVYKSEIVASPTSQPSGQPSGTPSTQPSRQPNSLPTRIPTCQPSQEPSSNPSAFPTGQPTRRPTVQPTRKPSTQPSGQPTRRPTVQPTRKPSTQPSGQPTQQPTRQPFCRPTCCPSSQPSGIPTQGPLSFPTTRPSQQPTRQPTSQPSHQPSSHPSCRTSTLVSPNLFMELIAGMSSTGDSGDGGPATSAQIRTIIPWVDSVGNMFLPDEDNRRIRKVSPSGIISAFGGTSSPAGVGQGGPIGSVRFNQPACVVGDSISSVLYISDLEFVWKYVISSGIATVFAQCGCLSRGFSGDNGQATSAQLYNPAGMWLTTSGDLYIADRENHRIRKVVTSSGIITTVAGSGCGAACSGSFSGDNGPATLATFRNPRSVYMDSLGRLFITDSVNYRLRVVATNGIVTTILSSGATTGGNIPATSAQLGEIMDVKGDSAGNIYIADGDNCLVRVIDSNIIVFTLFGSVCGGLSPGISPRTATLSHPYGIWIDSLSRIYFSDYKSIHRSIIVDSPTSKPSQQPTQQPTGQPTFQPVSVPSVQPTVDPSNRPSSQPSSRPTCRPFSFPTSVPSRKPSTQPSMQPTVSPSGQPSFHPSALPTMTPTDQPTSRPSRQPSQQPAAIPSSQPSGRPATRPSAQPTIQPSQKPSTQPTDQPSHTPTSQPSSAPSVQPISQPSSRPSQQPSAVPSDQPTERPTTQPSTSPSGKPIDQPSNRPTHQPTVVPSNQPTIKPTVQPSTWPSIFPSSSPSDSPTNIPTGCPSRQPSSIPTDIPSQRPFSLPSLQPTQQPTSFPSVCPTSRPSCRSTSLPSGQPSISPSTLPTTDPGIPPSASPTVYPSVLPSSWASSQPSSDPSCHPTASPTSQPSVQPTGNPTGKPSLCSSSQPSSQPTSVPSSQPSDQPTDQPLPRPSSKPSSVPTHKQSLLPNPTNQTPTSPTDTPTERPSSSVVSESPTVVPSNWPHPSNQLTSTIKPTAVLSFSPTVSSTTNHTNTNQSLSSVVPSNQPVTSAPSNQPTISSSNSSPATVIPSRFPTELSTTTRNSSSVPIVSSVSPTKSATVIPSRLPTELPTVNNSSRPTPTPTISSTMTPTVIPSSRRPSFQPTRSPTSSSPSFKPTFIPSPPSSTSPSHHPTVSPSLEPNKTHSPSFRLPTVIPTVSPTKAFSVLFPSERRSQLFRGSLFLLGRSFSSQSVITSLRDIHLDENDLPNHHNLIIFGRGENDNYNDIVIGSRPSHGLYSVVNEEQTSFFLDSESRSSTIIGDINSDGFDDLLIGYPQQSKCFIYLGNSKESFTDLGVSFAIYGATPGDDFGWAAAGLGDYNQDGNDDFLVSAKGTGFVCLFYGKKPFDGNDLSIEKMTKSDGFKIIGQENTFNTGLAVSNAGDFNHDGFTDILISALSFDGEGIIYLLFGNPHSSDDIDLNRFNAFMGFIFKAPPHSFSGLSVTGLGDFNQDGFDDIAIGSLPYQGGYSSQVTYVVFGRNYSFINSKNSNNSDYTLSISEMNKRDREGFKITGGGFLVSGVNDVNTDNIPDLMITNYPHWHTQQGNAYLIVYPGKNSVPSPPSYFPSSLPSSLPSQEPTARPSIPVNSPTNLPSIDFFDGDSASLASNKPTITINNNNRSNSDNNNDATRIPTFPPTPRKTFRPSLQKTSLPSTLRPSKTPSRSPTQITTSSSYPTTEVPTFPTRNLVPTITTTSSSSHPTRLTRSISSSSPSSQSFSNNSSIPTTDREDNDFISIHIQQEGHYNNATSNKNILFLIETSGNVVITGSNEGKNIYKFLPSLQKTEIRITNFKSTTDQLDFLAFPQFLSINDLPFTTNPLIIYPANNYKIIFDSLNTLPPTTETNFLFTEPDSEHSSSSYNFSDYTSSIELIAVLIPVVIMFFCFLCVWGGAVDNEKKEDKLEEQQELSDSESNDRDNNNEEPATSPLVVVDIPVDENNVDKSDSFESLSSSHSSSASLPASGSASFLFSLSGASTLGSQWLSKAEDDLVDDQKAQYQNEKRRNAFADLEMGLLLPDNQHDHDVDDDDDLSSDNLQHMFDDESESIDRVI
jgi:sugar lactone lactonase YvrE